METIEWLWLVIGLTTGAPLGALLMYWLYPPLRWNAEQRAAIASCQAQLDEIRARPARPPTDKPVRLRLIHPDEPPPADRNRA